MKLPFFSKSTDIPVGPLSLRRTRKVQVEDASSALTAAEYASIRSESLQSFATSQSIIQWSLATYGVLFGAGLLAASGEIAADLSSTVEWMAAVIYGLLLPGLVCAASWSWIGEIRRMERTGAYLRGVERRLRAETSSGRSSVVGPLNWESFLSGNPDSGAPPVKGWAPYLGTAMLFGGSLGTSVVFFFVWIDRIMQSGPAGSEIWILISVDAALIVLFLSVCIHTGLGVVRLGNCYWNFEEQAMRWVREPSGLARFVEPIAFVVALAGVAGLAYWLLPTSVLTW